MMKKNSLIPTRREMLGSMGSGLGMVALASMLGTGKAQGADNAPPGGGFVPGLADLPHHAAKAKRVVVLWQGGGPFPAQRGHVPVFRTAATPVQRVRGVGFLVQPMFD